MLRTTDDVVEVRRWAECRSAQPCRDAESGHLRLVLGQPSSASCGVGWDEFESTFVLTRCVLVYDDAPGSSTCFVGPPDEARAFVAQAACGPAYAPPPA